MKKTTVSCLLLTLIACNPKFQNPHTDISTLENTQTQEILGPKASRILQVTDLDGQAIAGAQILIGSRLGQPFINNLLQTNGSGQVTIPQEWTTPVSVTVNHPGYMRLTYLNVMPQGLTLKLRPIEKAERIELSGNTTGFGQLPRDGIADFGLVIPSLTKRDLFSFSIDKLISPELDTIQIAGIDAKVPSNLTFPKQKESYVIPVTLQKERYRLYFNENGTHKVYALHGKFPFEKVVDKIRNKVPFPSLVNDFTFTNGSIRDVEINGPTKINLPVNEMTFTSEETMIPPQLDSDKVMLAISLFENNGYLYPTDMHKVENTSAFKLKGLAKSHRLFLSMMMRTEDFNGRSGNIQEAVSAELMPQNHDHSPTFLGLIPLPSATTNGWTSQAPANNGSIHPLTTYSVLSKVYRNGKQKTIIREWEVYSENWIENLELPEWPATEALHENSMADQDSMGSTGTQRWELTYIGTNQKLPLPSHSKLGPDIVDYTSHISFNSIEF